MEGFSEEADEDDGTEWDYSFLKATVSVTTNAHGHLSGTVICAASPGQLINGIFDTLSRASPKSDPSIPCNLGAELQAAYLLSRIVIWGSHYTPCCP